MGDIDSAMCASWNPNKTSWRPMRQRSCRTWLRSCRSTPVQTFPARGEIGKRNSRASRWI